MTGERRHEELAALSAAGAADAEERAELARTIAEDPAAAEEAAAFADAAALLALELEPIAAPQGALDRIRAAIDGAASTARPDRDRGTGGTEIIALADRKRYRAVATTAAACAAAAAFAFLWLRERSLVTDLERDHAAEIGRKDRQQQALEQELTAEIAKAHAGQAAQQQLVSYYSTLRSSELELSTVVGQGGAVMKVFIAPDLRRWLVFAYELPPLPEDRDYQLWFVPATGTPISAGLLTVGDDGQLIANPEVPEGLGDVKAAISVEPKGGSPQPTMAQIKIIGDLI